MARMPGRTRQRFVIDLADVAREGRRWHAFYQGYQAGRRRRGTNPHEAGTDAHACWQAGWKYAEGER